MTGRIGRTRRLTAASVASLGIASIAAAAALGHIPGAGNGLAPTTAGPDLRTVSVAPDAGNPEQAKYCFDSAIDTISPAALAAPAGFFNIQTYDSRRGMSPVSIAKDTDQPACVIATFAGGLDLPQGTVGEVVPGAVRDLASRSNITGSEPLSGSVSVPSPGATTGPDLIDVVKNTSVQADKTATFVFDENINATPAVPYNPTTGFAFYDGAGTPQFALAAPAPNVSGNRITVHFGGVDTPLESATRFVVNEGAVQDRPQSFFLAGATTLHTPSSPGIVNKGALSARPEVTGAAADGPQSFKITFNQAVSLGVVNPAGFRAISDDGSNPADAMAIGSGGSPDSVIATFPPALIADPSSIVKIVVNAGSIRAAQDGTTPNVGSQAATSTPNAAPGYTNGPDLLAVGVDLSKGRVTFKYDEPVGGTPAATSFRGLAADGSVINSTGGIVASGVFVNANFPVTVSGAVAFENPFGGLTDPTGRPSPHQSVSKDLQQAAGPGPQPPPPPPPPPPAAKPRFKTTVTIKRRGRVYSGRVNSARKACRQGRRVILKRRGSGRRFGTAFSRRTSTYSIRRKTRLRGRVYVYVTPRSTSINCLPGKSRVIRG